MRIDSVRQMKNGGWLHDFESDYKPPPPLPKPDKPSLLRADLLMHGWRQNTSRDKLDALAISLCVSLESLDDLGVAHAPEHNAFAFPMRNERGDICGIRLRNDQGDKWAVRGSKAGVFFSQSALMRLSTNRIFIVEGATDTAAALSIGIFAIGRHACIGQEEIIVAILDQLGPTECVVVFDNDERTENGKTRRPGVDGAEKLCAMLSVRTARFIPPGKDLRELIASGATKPLIDTMLNNCLWTRSKKKNTFFT